MSTNRKWNTTGLSGRIDFVSEGAFLNDFSDGVIEPGHELIESLTVAPPQHDICTAPFRGDGHAADRIHLTDGDISVFDEPGEIRKGSILVDCLWAQAAVRVTVGRLGTRC